MAETAAPPPTGCLTDAQLAQLQAAAPGKAPEAFARHLASCERCQARALFGGERRRASSRKAPPTMPSLRRALFLTALILAAVAAFAWTVQKLAARVP
jgi:hypothetical protein